MGTYTYSDWHQLGEIEVLMANVHSAHYGLLRDAEDQADVFIDDGTESGVGHPQGRYTWNRALGGPFPQHDGNAYFSGFPGTQNYSSGGRWYNNVDQAEYVAAPTIHWPQPGGSNNGRYGAPAFAYGYQWDTLINNGSLTSFWDGTMLHCHLDAVQAAAGPLGTGVNPSVDPTDPLYSGLFPPGAQVIELETASSELVSLKAAGEESDLVPTESPGRVKDTQDGASWSLVHTIPGHLVNAWGYYDYDSGPYLQTTETGGAGTFANSAWTDNWGVLSHEELSISAAGAVSPTFSVVPVATIRTNSQGSFWFMVVPAPAYTNTAPAGFDFGATEVQGDVDDGSWVTFRPVPLFALKATVLPTRIRARYFTEDPDVEPPPPGTGKVKGTRARFTG